ncbi:galactose mutarotase-like domain-containing protein [Cadophora sp. MPI-SDFR-AT-0126]|nr:galactose mutarotase-like domain-containing protein [Leotiomycetes sp. MPI-SDFR-AT-0126]
MRNGRSTYIAFKYIIRARIFMPHHTASGRDYHESSILNQGGALANLWINNTFGQEIDIVMGLDNATQYAQYDGALGGALGRYAGLISGASFELNGKRWKTSQNGKNGQKPVTVNGGKRGWGNIKLDVAVHTKDTLTFFIYDRGANGFPGVSGASLTHTVTPFAWHMSYGSTPMKEAGPLDLSHQVFWNLDGFVENSTRTIEKHKLSLPYSGLRLGIDEDRIPTGDIHGNKKNSGYDFWSGPRPLDVALSRTGDTSPGLDNTFLTSRSQPWAKDHKPVASLESEQSGVKLDFYADQEALQVVTWNHPDGSIPLKKKQGNGTYPMFAGISLQAQDWTDAINHPEWQRDDKIIWGPDRCFIAYSTFKFSVQK